MLEDCAWEGGEFPQQTDGTQSRALALPQNSLLVSREEGGRKTSLRPVTPFLELSRHLSNKSPRENASRSPMSVNRDLQKKRDLARPCTTLPTVNGTQGQRIQHPS
jgi:hypothetical protein